MTEEPADRLRRARKKKGFRGPTDAARAYGWNINTYRSHENGIRDLSRQAAERYAATLNVSIGWLLTGENPPSWLNNKEEIGNTEQPVRRIPVLTTEQAFSLTQQHKLEQLKDIQDYTVIGVDPMLGTDVFALIIDDEAMLPEFHLGEFIAVDPAIPIKPGDFVAIGINSRNSTIVREYRIKGYNEDGSDRISLKALNDAWPDLDFIPGETGKIIGKIVWHMRRF